jgi:hypothetical protein
MLVAPARVAGSYVDVGTLISTGMAALLPVMYGAHIHYLGKFCV